jgi:hypothetical protein
MEDVKNTFVLPDGLGFQVFLLFSEGTGKLELIRLTFDLTLARGGSAVMFFYLFTDVQRLPIVS